MLNRCCNAAIFWVFTAATFGVLLPGFLDSLGQGNISDSLISGGLSLASGAFAWLYRGAFVLLK